ncbi:MAG: 2-phosphosulfolactate phosphatase [Pirellulales bacterium]
MLPCLTIEVARTTAAALPAGTALLGGERGGLPIPGFDFGNSPCDYTADRVSGRTLVFTTTNGTLAMERCRAAHAVFIGAFAQLTAVADAVRRRADGRTIHLLCAGTNGHVTREDVLCAGAFVESFLRVPPFDRSLTDDSARLALDAWRAAEIHHDSARLTAALHETQGGRNLAKLGLASDVADAAALDRFAVAPELDIVAWRIIAAH